MPARIDWLIPNAILLTVADTISSPDVTQDFAQQVQAFLSQGDDLTHWVANIVKVEQSSLTPAQAVEAFRYLKDIKNLGWLVVVGTAEQRTLRFMATIVGTMVGVRLKIVTDMDAAFDFLVEHDERFSVEQLQQAYVTW